MGGVRLFQSDRSTFTLPAAKPVSSSNAYPIDRRLLFQLQSQCLGSNSYPIDRCLPFQLQTPEAIYITVYIPIASAIY